MCVINGVKYEVFDTAGDPAQRALWRQLYSRRHFDYVVFVVDGEPRGIESARVCSQYLVAHSISLQSVSCCSQYLIAYVCAAGKGPWIKHEEKVEEEAKKVVEQARQEVRGEGSLWRTLCCGLCYLLALLVRSFCLLHSFVSDEDCKTEGQLRSIARRNFNRGLSAAQWRSQLRSRNRASARRSRTGEARACVCALMLAVGWRASTSARVCGVGPQARAGCGVGDGEAIAHCVCRRRVVPPHTPQGARVLPHSHTHTLPC